ncbi:MAG TPA: universal stress protein [Usitatibacter sp.]|nr:universal stress protein [Usitatibacter sp.]
MAPDPAAGDVVFRHILFPTDGSNLSANAARYAVALARALGARLTALHVIAPFMPPFPDLAGVYAYADGEEEYQRVTQAEAGQILAAVGEAARAANVPFESVRAVSGTPWDAIVRTAQEAGCDAIVMASHGRKGVSALVLGSETVKVLTHCNIPVLVTR